MSRRRSARRPEEQVFCQAADGACYVPERDGALEQYLAAQFHGDVFRLFRGLPHFELLRDKCWLKPGVSIIRLMYNIGRGDEHYAVTDGFRLQGIEHPHHGAPAGIVEPATLLSTAPPFEAHALFGPAWEQMVERDIDTERKRLTELGIL